MYVALLRGVNVGGKNLVPMKDLASVFSKEGCQSVRTYIQSGNVVFHAEDQMMDGLADRISQRILGRFGCRVPVLLRSTSDFRMIIRNNPFVGTDANEEMLHVYFLASKPRQESVATLDHQRSLPDRFHLHEREVYVSIPRGAAYTKLTTSYFDLMLNTVSTCRNWRTVLKLAELSGA